METPALILDIDRLSANAERMLTHCADLGITLRPHVKTPKSVDVARLATGGRMSTITVSTLAEAEHFARAGFTDILYAVGITPNKFARACRIGPGLMLAVDSVEMAVALAESDLPNPVLIEIDCGEHRGGLPVTDPALEQIARALGPQFEGIMSHAGHAYATDDLAMVRQTALAEADAARQAADRLRKGGLAVPTVSIGSTPTVLHARNLNGITELRAGIYLFCDLSQAGRNICGFDDIALTVLATVIGHNRAAGVLTVDAGALAMSKDIGAEAHLPDAGYGWLCDPVTLAPLGLSIKVVHQEHGTVPVRDPGAYDRLPIGSMVRILPVHACLTAAGGHGQYHLTDGRIWPRVDGWT
ncbi:alanine racemase [Roseobacter weihaiensis]|uniref:alanine racemase n=1 Tax=Roseobacter weihaiensis TaxID=2763262 RepID=UPI001D09D503|nr:alanine racemase [Roseobacter sp. H9]